MIKCFLVSSNLFALSVSAMRINCYWHKSIIFCSWLNRWALMPLGTDKKSKSKFSHLKILNGGISKILVAQSIWLPNLVLWYCSRTSKYVPIGTSSEDPSMKINILNVDYLIKKEAINIEKIEQVKSHNYISLQWPICLKCY